MPVCGLRDGPYGIPVIRLKIRALQEYDSIPSKLE